MNEHDFNSLYIDTSITYIQATYYQFIPTTLPLIVFIYSPQRFHQPLFVDGIALYVIQSLSINKGWPQKT